MPARPEIDGLAHIFGNASDSEFSKYAIEWISISCLMFSVRIEHRNINLVLSAASAESIKSYRSRVRNSVFYPCLFRGSLSLLDTALAARYDRFGKMRSMFSRSTLRPSSTALSSVQWRAITKSSASTRARTCRYIENFGNANSSLYMSL